MEQLILHLIGDYCTQSDWMAQNKTKRWFPAIAHATIYSLPFLLIGSWTAVLVIWLTHAVIDRFRLARYLCWAKNWIAPWETRWIAEAGGHHKIPPNWPWKSCQATGYPPETPAWLAVWLMILADNTIHLAINYCALRWL